MSTRTLNRTLLMGLLVVLTIIWLTPIVITGLVAVKSNTDYAQHVVWALPNSFALRENVEFAWNKGKLGTSFINTLLYASVGAAGAIIIASLAAFSLVHLRPRFSFGWFMIIYSGTIFPFQMYLLPLYRLYLDYNYYDTKKGLYVFYIAICIPFCLFVLRNFFITIPLELSEAGRLDGLSSFGVYVRIYLPLSFAPMAALFLFQFTWIWNDLLFGLTLARSDNVRPLMVGLAGMRGIYAGSNMPGVLSGALIASVPTLLIFLVLRRYLLQGMVLTTQGE
jgi:ABC-type glycerol-3-phosphate transport system permease component